MASIKDFIEENAVDEGFLQDWYQHSVTDEPPVWTDEHIAEVCGDFYLIPKESVEKTDVEQTTSKDIPKKIIPRNCWNCESEDCLLPDGNPCDKNFNRCPNCGDVLDNDYSEQYKHCPNCGQALVW